MWYRFGILFSIVALAGGVAYEVMLCFPPPGMVIIPGSADLGQVPIHEYQQIECLLQNKSGEGVSFLGCTNNCNSDRCTYVEDCPKQLAPGEEHRVTVNLAANKPGPFAHDVVFFNTSRDRPRLVLKVRGVAVVAP